MRVAIKASNVLCSVLWKGEYSCKTAEHQKINHHSLLFMQIEHDCDGEKILTKMSNNQIENFL